MAPGAKVELAADAHSKLVDRRLEDGSLHPSKEWIRRLSEG